MSDPTDASPDRQDGPDGPDGDGPASLPPSEVPGSTTGPIGDETARVPVEPEVGWNAPEAPRSMPWEAPAATVPPTTRPPDAGPSDGTGDDPTAAGGVLSAATVGWVAPPPVPLATGQPGWVIASVGSRLAAWILDGIIGFFLFLVLAFVFGIVAAAIGTDSTRLPDWVFLIATVAFFYVYFVGFWTSGGKATPGMRVFKLQVANAADGKRLSIEAATIRWLALGYAIALIGLIPILTVISSFASIGWSIALLITTSQDGMHQGLHDRWAKSVVVRPEAAGAGGGAAMACLVVIGILLVFAFISIIGLILLGSQVSSILDAAGESV